MSLARRKTDVFKWIGFSIVFCFSLFIFHWEHQFINTDLQVHARLASEFDFMDFHSISQRLAYPLWHVFTALLFQLGVPLAWAASIISTLFKMAGMFVVWHLIRKSTDDSVSDCLVSVATFLLMFITGICIPDINLHVYRPIGSPTVWHNPTQITVIVTTLICIPLIASYINEFIKRRDSGETKITLSSKKIVILTLLLLVNVVSKPTFLQAAIPATALFFLIHWILNIKEWRFFLQIILAFLPATLLLLMQFLYYTGVIVPYTSGIRIFISDVSFTQTMRNVLMMNAFPFFTLVACYKKGLFKNQQLLLILLIVAVAAFEAMTFHETGVREGHGNFFWAGMSMSLVFFVFTISLYLQTMADYFKNKHRKLNRGILLTLDSLFLLWHVFSGFYYVYDLLSRSAAF